MKHRPLQPTLKTEENHEQHNKEIFDLETVFEQTKSSIYNLGYRFFNNYEDALDFSQEVYTQVWHKRNTFNHKAKVSSWVYRIAMNIGINRIKRNRLLDFTSLPIEEINETKILEQKPQQELEKLQSQELKSFVYKELNKLQNEFRIPLLLYYYEKVSYRTIAEKLNIKENTIKSYIRRGKRILANNLKDNLKKY